SNSIRVKAHRLSEVRAVADNVCIVNGEEFVFSTVLKSGDLLSRFCSIQKKLRVWIRCGKGFSGAGSQSGQAGGKREEVENGWLGGKWGMWRCTVAMAHL